MPTATLKARMAAICDTGAPLATKTGSISSDVDRITATSVPTVTTRAL